MPGKQKVAHLLWSHGRATEAQIIEKCNVCYDQQVSEQVVHHSLLCMGLHSQRLVLVPLVVLMLWWISTYPHINCMWYLKWVLQKTSSNQISSFSEALNWSVFNMPLPTYTKPKKLTQRYSSVNSLVFTFTCSQLADAFILSDLQVKYKERKWHEKMFVSWQRSQIKETDLLLFFCLFCWCY